MRIYLVNCSFCIAECDDTTAAPLDESRNIENDTSELDSRSVRKTIASKHRCKIPLSKRMAFT